MAVITSQILDISASSTLNFRQWANNSNKTVVDINALNAALALAETNKLDRDFTGVVTGATGSAIAPTYSFTGDTNTGLYRIAADTIGFTTNGVLRVTVSTTGVTSTLGFSATTGTFSGALSAGSGAFTGEVSGASGTFTGALAAATGTFSNSVSNAGGTVALPSYTFTGDTNTGLYRVSADVLGFATNGTKRVEISDTTLTSTVAISGTSATFAGILTASNGVFTGVVSPSVGSVTSPAYTFTGDTDTGFYRVAADSIGISTAGVKRVEISTTAFTSSIPFSGTTGTFSGAVSGTTGTFSGVLTGASGIFTGGVTSGGFTVVNYGTIGTFTKPQRSAPVALSDTTTIAVNLDLSNKFTLNLGGNRTLGNPTLTASMIGQSVIIFVTQDVTGGRTLSYGSFWKFSGGTAPILSTGASTTDVIVGEVMSTSKIVAHVVFGFA